MKTETFHERVMRLRERTSVAGWKGPGSAAASSATWDIALRLVSVVAEEIKSAYAREPFVSVGANGSVFLSYNFEPGGTTVEVEIRADGTIECDEACSSGTVEVGSEKGEIVSRVRSLAA